MQYVPFNPQNEEHIQAVADIWSAACGPELAITSRFVRFNTTPGPCEVQTGLLATQNGYPVGFILVATMDESPYAVFKGMGWVNAMGVRPQYQKQGVGSHLLMWGEAWLNDRGCTLISLGRGIRWFVSGVPVSVGSAGFFARHGYKAGTEAGSAWDMARSLGGYTTPPTAQRDLSLRVAPLDFGQENLLLEFLRSELSPRWVYDFEDYLRSGGRLSDYIALWSERGIDGVCRIGFEDSWCPIDRFFPHWLPRPWGQLGYIGVSQDRRGMGYGGVILDGGLRQLRDKGVNGCVIDWTTKVGFYGKFGFKSCREYLLWEKTEVNK